MEFLLIRPVDVLHLRGNRLFADAGHGEAVMPPWPSVFAGALRGRILVDRGVSFHDFNSGRVRDDQIAMCIGNGPAQLGSFRVAAVALAGPPPGLLRTGAPTGYQAEANTVYLPLPADLVARTEDDGVHFERLDPNKTAKLGVRGNFPLDGVPILRVANPAKAESGIWLTHSAYLAHLCGAAVPSGEWVRASELWKSEVRLGIGLRESQRTVRTGLLYTTESVALRREVAFLVGVRGSEGFLPRSGLLRLGGDGRGAAVEPWEASGSGPTMPWAYVPRTPGFRMILSTSGFFPQGWLPPAVVQEDGSGCSPIRVYVRAWWQQSYRERKP